NATFTPSSLSADQHFITATYSGDSTHTSGSARLVQKVHAAASTTSVTASPNPAPFGQTVTITATVTGTGGTPTGMVTLPDGSTVLASAVPVDGTGHAAFSTSGLGVGNHTITATFNGSTGWLTSSGNAAAQLVQDGTATTVTSSPNPSNFGQSVTFTATVSAA